MALINCSECGKQVSTEAAACPHCGAPIKAEAVAVAAPAKTRGFFKFLGWILIGLFALSIIFQIFGKKETPAPTPSQAVPTEAPIPKMDSVQSIPAVASHNYSVEDDGEYGYEPGISEEDEKNGVKSKSMLMIRYFGESAGTWTIQTNDSPVRINYSCKDQCDFIKAKTYLEGALVKTETIRNAQGSVLNAIFQDATTGKLSAYSKRKKAAQGDASQQG